MGYTTDFRGFFRITPTLKPEHKEYLVKFSQTRRMHRNAAIAATFADPVREAAGIKSVGVDGRYFVGGQGDFGQATDCSILSFNNPPQGQPNLWCQWIPNDEGDALMWDGNEKFYDYIPWLEYLINHFFAKWGYALNGRVDWRGESWTDMGTIEVLNNKVNVLRTR